MDVSRLFSFSLPIRVEFGVGVINNIALDIQKSQASRVLIITDRGVMAAGITAKVEQEIRKEALVEVVDIIEPNPRDTTVERCADVGRTMNTDLLIAVGGGSVIDAAKATGVLLTSGGKLLDYEGRNKVPHPITPLIAIPTTSGTGSEATFSSVITDTRSRRKFSINSRLVSAYVAYLDPELTISLPPDITAATGMDALTHAIEALSATCSNPISDIAALAAIKLIDSGLKTAVRKGSNMRARSEMLLGSLLAGIAFANADVGAVHCMAEALGGAYDTPHGIANSIFLPWVMKYNLPAAKDKYGLAARAMGLETEGLIPLEAGELAVKYVEELSSAVGIPSFSELGILGLDLEELARVAASNGSVSSNPRPVGEQEFLDLFTAAMNSGLADC